MYVFPVFKYKFGFSIEVTAQEELSLLATHLSSVMLCMMISDAIVIDDGLVVRLLIIIL